MYVLVLSGLSFGSDNFVLCPKEALHWETRKLRVLEEILRYNPAILCMQEVDQFDFLTENLSKHGYVGIFYPKPDSPCLYQKDNSGSDGCAIFYLSKCITLSQSNCMILKENGVASNQVAIIGEFCTKEPSSRQFYVGVTHLKAKRGYEDVRRLQGEFISSYLTENYKDAPVIFCGDFNAEPKEPLYTVMSSCPLNFGSVYTSLSPDGKTEPKYTTWKVRPKGEECHVIDYIWYTKSGLKVKSVLDIATEEEIGKNRLPSARYPSDHLSLICDFLLVDKK